MCVNDFAMVRLEPPFTNFISSKVDTQPNHHFCNQQRQTADIRQKYHLQLSGHSDKTQPSFAFLVGVRVIILTCFVVNCIPLCQVFVQSVAPTLCPLTASQ